MLLIIIFNWLSISFANALQPTQLCRIFAEEKRHSAGTVVYNLAIDGVIEAKEYTRLSEVIQTRNDKVKNGRCVAAVESSCRAEIGKIGETIFTYSIHRDGERFSEKYWDVSDVVTMQKVMVREQICGGIDQRLACTIQSPSISEFVVVRGEEPLAPSFESQPEAQSFLEQISGPVGLCP